MLDGVGRAPAAFVAAKPRYATSRSANPPGPTQPTKVSNCFNSQFQVPLLFYVLVILAWITKQADLLFVVMAWIFVILRLAHAYIHTTSNHVPTRFNVFAAACWCCW